MPGLVPRNNTVRSEQYSQDTGRKFCVSVYIILPMRLTGLGTADTRRCVPSSMYLQQKDSGVRDLTTSRGRGCPGRVEWVDRYVGRTDLAHMHSRLHIVFFHGITDSCGLQPPQLRCHSAGSVIPRPDCACSCRTLAATPYPQIGPGMNSCDHHQNTFYAAAQLAACKGGPNAHEAR